MSVEQISSQLSFALIFHSTMVAFFSGSRRLLEGLRLGRSGKLHSHSAPSSLPVGRVGELHLLAFLELVPLVPIKWPIIFQVKSQPTTIILSLSLSFILKISSLLVEPSDEI